MTGETMAYWILGTIGYFVAWFVLGSVGFLCWRLWCINKYAFWEYVLEDSLRIYYSKLWRFVQDHWIAYGVVQILFWPVVLPVLLGIMTKAVIRYERHEYVY